MNAPQRVFASYLAQQNSYSEQDLAALKNKALKTLQRQLHINQLEQPRIHDMLSRYADDCVSLYNHAQWLGYTNLPIEEGAQFLLETSKPMLALVEEA